MKLVCVDTVLMTSESVPRMFKSVPRSCLVLPSVCSTLSASVLVFLIYSMFVYFINMFWGYWRESPCKINTTIFVYKATISCTVFSPSSPPSPVAHIPKRGVTASATYSAIQKISKMFKKKTCFHFVIIGYCV